MKMGLDIIVNVTVNDVQDSLEQLSRMHEIEARRILSELDLSNKARIHTRPGGYSGLHLVRREYATTKGWSNYLKHGIGKYEDEVLSSHLLYHSDCDGYYLPECFPNPQWIECGDKRHISVGSSCKLLQELEEMLPTRDKWPDGLSWRWDAIFIASVASVVTDTVIEFR